MIAPIHCRLSDSQYCALLDAVSGFYNRREENALVKAYLKGVTFEECFELLGKI